MSVLKSREHKQKKEDKVNTVEGQNLNGKFSFLPN